MNQCSCTINMTRNSYIVNETFLPFPSAIRMLPILKENREYYTRAITEGEEYTPYHCYVTEHDKLSLYEYMSMRILGKKGITLEPFGHVSQT